MAVTTTKDEWNADHWFGSIATLANAAQVAEGELIQIDGAAAEEQWGRLPAAKAGVNYSGGSFDAENLAELREELGKLEARSDIDSLDFTITTPNYYVSIRATGFGGVSVGVSGTGATVVHGLVSTLQRKLEPGVGRVRQQALKPLEGVQIFFFLLGWVWGLGFGYLVVSDNIEHGFDIVSSIFFVFALFGPILGTAALLDRSRPSPPALQLVPAAEEDVPPSPPDERGPVLLARDWLRDHPLLTLAGALVLAVAGNLITNAIT